MEQTLRRTRCWIFREIQALGSLVIVSSEHLSEHLNFAAASKLLRRRSSGGTARFAAELGADADRKTGAYSVSFVGRMEPLRGNFRGNFHPQGSHSPRNCLRRMAGSTGLEPAASAVTGQRSNQLNYDPASGSTRCCKPKWDKGIAGLAFRALSAGVACDGASSSPKPPIIRQQITVRSCEDYINTTLILDRRRVQHSQRHLSDI
jgi:hypothetical protein